MSRMRIADVNEKAESNLALIDRNAEIINCSAEHLRGFEERQKFTNKLIAAAVVVCFLLHLVL